MLPEGDRADSLRAVLEDACRLGFTGPGPADDHVAHAEGFVEVLRAEWGSQADEAGREPLRVLDLGSGAGLPGLVVALAVPSAWVALLDASTKRAAFLHEAVDRLGVADRCVVLGGRAEELGRDLSLRETFGLVTARSFGAPPVTVECAAPFLRVGGLLVTSEPPDRPGRWPAAPLESIGMGTATVVRCNYTYAVLRKVGTISLRFPRRTGIPAKRPLF